MDKQLSFRLLDDSLNRALLSLLKKAKIDYSLDEDGSIHYSAVVNDVVENDLICSIRDQVFPSWQVLTCPNDWVERYRDFMINRGIPFKEELSDGEFWFLIPRKYRPHAWKLDDPARKNRLEPQSSK
jgi:hypothetical protein